MISQERKDELNFYLHNKYPIMVTSLKHSDTSHYNNDVYTISEMIFENIFTILDYDKSGRTVSFLVNNDLLLFNGITTVSIAEGQRIDFSLDEVANKEFAHSFFPEYD